MRILDTRKGGKMRSGYLWAYASGEKSGLAIVCFDSQTGRGHEQSGLRAGVDRWLLMVI